VLQELYEAFKKEGRDVSLLNKDQIAKRSDAVVKKDLQMLKLAKQPDKWSIGPALCAGLSLVHYKSFTAASLLPV
jgi:hypothetical protein